MQHNCTGPSTARFPSLEGVLTFLKLRYEEMELSRETCFEAPKCVHSLEALVLFHFFVLFDLLLQRVSLRIPGWFGKLYGPKHKTIHLHAERKCHHTPQEPALLNCHTQP